MNIKTVENLNLKGKTILLRTDFNVPLENGKIVDDKRIVNALKTINDLLSQNCKIIILSHLGRPKGQKASQFSLQLAANRLQQLLPKIKIHFSPEILGSQTTQATNNLNSGEILVLENLRFDMREEKNDQEFAKQLSMLGNFYVNEAFAVSHRSHASIVDIPKFLPSAAGFSFTNEVRTLLKIKQEAEKPIIIVLGGKKKDKLKFIEPLSQWANQVLIGGLLPRIVNKEGQNAGKTFYASLTADGKDITLESADKFKEIIVAGKTIVWNGTMDLFEDRHNQAGTRIVATAIVEADAKRYAGGGDTTSAIKQLNLLDKFDFISSGGGAMLEMLANETLAGLNAIHALD